SWSYPASIRSRPVRPRLELLRPETTTKRAGLGHLVYRTAAERATCRYRYPLRGILRLLANFLGAVVQEGTSPMTVRIEREVGTHVVFQVPRSSIDIEHL